jgi:WhiB family redox-sensing transcriptional regulator
VNPVAAPVGRMSPFTVLPREQRRAKTATTSEPHNPDVGTDWMLDGACNGADPALFQPIGDSSLYSAQIEDARAVCRGCPVIASCREYSLETRQPAGIWAAMTERDRAQELRRRARIRQRQAAKT